MRTTLDCVPCLVRQALEASRFATADPTLQTQVVREALATLVTADYAASPPALAQVIHARVRELTGAEDPYKTVKRRLNEVVLDLWSELREQVLADPDPFAAALRLAVSGNVIDLGVDGSLTADEIRAALRGALAAPFVGDIERLRGEIRSAERILYLLDNTGEIVLDRLFADWLPLGRVTFAVRGGAVVNDVTMADAQAVGLTQIAQVISNGSNAPGTVLSDCNQEFRERFRTADLIIAKGQGNYETLSDERANIAFLFKVKCSVVADKVGLAEGTHALIWQRDSR